MKSSPLYRYRFGRALAALATVFFVVARFGALWHVHHADEVCASACVERAAATPETPPHDDNEDCSLCDVLAWQATGAISFVAHLSSAAFFRLAPVSEARLPLGSPAARPSDRAPPAPILS